MKIKGVVDLLYLFVEGKFTEEDITRLFNLASVSHFKKKIGLPEQYQPGMPYPKEALDITHKITIDLLPFKVMMDGKRNPFLFFSDGFANLPTDFYYHYSLSLLMATGDSKFWRPVDVVTDDVFEHRITSYIETPDEWNPICNYQNGFLRIAPEKRVGRFDYLKLPREAVYATKLQDGVKVFDQNNSVDIEWDRVNTYDIMYLMLSDMGVKVEKPELYQVAERHKIEGV